MIDNEELLAAIGKMIDEKISRAFEQFRAEEIFRQTRTRIVKVKEDESCPENDADAILQWTNREVNKHLDTLCADDVKDIINEAITGKPAVRKQQDLSKRIEGGTNGAMAAWLNQNVPVVNTQANVWASIDEAQQLARERVSARLKEAEEFTKIHFSHLAEPLAIAAKAANVDTAATKEQLTACLENRSTEQCISVSPDA